MPKLSTILWKNTILYFLWMVAHYGSTYLYTRLCVPTTLIGMILSPFTIGAPHCIAIRWLISKSGNTICMMWMVVGNAILVQTDWLSNPIQDDDDGVYEVVSEET
jgi:hypothetical protein